MYKYRTSSNDWDVQNLSYILFKMKKQYSEYTNEQFYTINWIRELCRLRDKGDTVILSKHEFQSLIDMTCVE